MDWPHLVFQALDWTWFLLGALCLIFAAVFVLREQSVSETEKYLRELRASRRRGLLIAGFCLPVLLALYNLARHKIYYLTSDSAANANMAWNVAHGNGLRTMLLGDHSFFTLHFSFAVELFSPLLWLWNDIGVLAVVQGLALGSAPLALFALAQGRAKTALVSWIVLLLAIAHPCYNELARTVIDNSVYALPFFVWAAYFFERDQFLLGSLFGLLMFSAREQVPFVFFGIGLFLLMRRRKRAGAAVMAAAVLIFMLELQAMKLAQMGGSCNNSWDYFKGLGKTPGMIMSHALTRPWDFIVALANPPAKLLPVFWTLAHAAVLPILGGAYFLPALVAWVPHQLAPYGSMYQSLQAHYPGCVLGPLLWAMLHGLIRIQEKLSPSAWRKLASLLLVVAGWGLLGAPRFFFPDQHVIPRAWGSAAPKALAMIPPEAKVWADGYLLPNLAMRRYIKGLPAQLSECNFAGGLFLPDFVLMSDYWVKGVEPRVSDSLFRFLRDRGFRVVFREADLSLYANPRGGGPGSGPAEPVKFP